MKGFFVWKLNKKVLNLLLELNIDFVWISDLQEEKYIKELRRNKVKIFSSVGIFIGQDKLEKQKFCAVNKTVNHIREYAGWYVGLCPSNQELRQKRIDKIKTIFESDLYDGIFLDSIRYPTYWEIEKPEYLDTCYCKKCLQLFDKAKKEGFSWKQFRINQINSFVEKVVSIKKSKKIGYFAVPESRSNLENVFAQPFETFADTVDFVSPMIYPQMVGKNLEWAAKTVKRFQGAFGKEKTIPIVQVVKMPEDSKDKFGEDDAINLSETVKLPALTGGASLNSGFLGERNPVSKAISYHSSTGLHRWPSGTGVKILGNIGYFMLDQVISRPAFVKQLISE